MHSRKDIWHLQRFLSIDECESRNEVNVFESQGSSFDIRFDEGLLRYFQLKWGGKTISSLKKSLDSTVGSSVSHKIPPSTQLSSFLVFVFLNIRINTTSTAWMNATRSCNRDVATWKREEWMHYHLIYHLFGSQLKYLHYVYHVAI